MRRAVARRHLGALPFHRRALAADGPTAPPLHSLPADPAPALPVVAAPPHGRVRCQLHCQDLALLLRLLRDGGAALACPGAIIATFPLLRAPGDGGGATAAAPAAPGSSGPSSRPLGPAFRVLLEEHISEPAQRERIMTALLRTGAATPAELRRTRSAAEGAAGVIFPSRARTEPPWRRGRALFGSRR